MKRLHHHLNTEILHKPIRSLRALKPICRRVGAASLGVALVSMVIPGPYLSSCCLFFLAFGVVPVCAIWPRVRSGEVCEVCDYLLTGNTSGRCPECGTLATEMDTLRVQREDTIRGLLFMAGGVLAIGILTHLSFVMFFLVDSVIYPERSPLRSAVHIPFGGSFSRVGLGYRLWATGVSFITACMGLFLILYAVAYRATKRVGWPWYGYVLALAVIVMLSYLCIVEIKLLF